MPARRLLSCAAVVDGISDTIPVNRVNLSSSEIVVPATTKFGVLSCVVELQTGKSVHTAPPVDVKSKLEHVMKYIKFDTVLLGFPG